MRAIIFPSNLQGMEIHILEEFNLIVSILTNEDVDFISASNYLLHTKLNYFSSVIEDNIIFIKQTQLKIELKNEYLIKKVY